MGVSCLSEEERVLLMGYAARATWPAGFRIYERGTRADGVFVVVRGSVVLRTKVRTGRGFVPWISAAGETFGAEGLSPFARYATEARTDVETDTIFLSYSDVRALLREQPMHGLALIGQVIAERTALLEKLREITTLSVEQRLIAALHKIAAQRESLDTSGRIELTSARYRLLCERVGAARESVSLVLGRLVSEGLVIRAGSTLYVEPSSSLFARMEAIDDEPGATGVVDAHAESALR